MAGQRTTGTDGPALGAEQLARAFIGEFPDRAACVLEGYPVADCVALLRGLPAAQLAALLSRMNPGYASRCIGALPLARVAEALRRLDRVDAAALLRMLPARRRAAVLERLPRRLAIPLQWLLRHPAHAVGAWTDATALALSADIMAGAALMQLREAACADDTLYVLDRDRHLRGLVSVATLVAADANLAVAELMGEAPAALQSQASLAAVAQAGAWRRHATLPVVDWRQRFIGVLRAGDLDRGLQRASEAPAIPLSDTLLDAGQAYWTGMAAALRASIALLSEPVSRHDKEEP